MIDSLWTKNQIKSVPVIQDFSKRGLSKSYQKWLLHIIVQSSQFKIKFCIYTSFQQVTNPFISQEPNFKTPTYNTIKILGGTFFNFLVTLVQNPQYLINKFLGCELHLSEVKSLIPTIQKSVYLRSATAQIQQYSFIIDIRCNIMRSEIKCGIEINIKLRRQIFCIRIGDKNNQV
ncbi:unnamed protein product [Paramecium primaurelia]|uniref:Uncharacterized protein n=1 Tax=Paramecium primaurelia TaxID=5886 RepID=A0A8S1MZG1_PARPR|nr:unnamed protein product [Paramecium primaurelia]